MITKDSSVVNVVFMTCHVTSVTYTQYIPIKLSSCVKGYFCKIPTFLQLSELNVLTSSDVQWEIKGTKVLPKSLRVAKLTTASFMKTIIFDKIKKKLMKAAFNQR